MDRLADASVEFGMFVADKRNVLFGSAHCSPLDAMAFHQGRCLGGVAQACRGIGKWDGVPDFMMQPSKGGTEGSRSMSSILIPLILVVAVIVVVLQVVGNVAAGKMRGEAMEDPRVRDLLIEPIERWGTYDGSTASECRADEALRVLERRLMPASSRTRQLYRAALGKNLAIPLAAVYAYAVGEYVENPMMPPINAGTPEARTKVAGTRLMFPKLYYVAVSELAPHKVEQALCVAANLLDYFLDVEAIESRFS